MRKTAREIAEMMYWDVDPCPKAKMNPTGIVIQQELRVWNAQAEKSYRAWKRLAADLELSK